MPSSHYSKIIWAIHHIVNYTFNPFINTSYIILCTVLQTCIRIQGMSEGADLVKCKELIAVQRIQGGCLIINYSPKPNWLVCLLSQDLSQDLQTQEAEYRPFYFCEL